MEETEETAASPQAKRRKRDPVFESGGPGFEMAGGDDRPMCTEKLCMRYLVLTMHISLRNPHIVYV